MPSYEEVTQRAESLRSMTGFTEQEFEALLPPFERAFMAYMQDHTIEGQPRTVRRYRTYDTCPLPTTADKLLFILTYMKQNPIQEVQGQLFGMSQSNVNKWIHLLHTVLNQSLAHQELLPARTADELAVMLAAKRLRDTPEPPAIRQPEPTPGTFTYLDFKNGFRDLTFGEPPTKDMHLVEEAGELKFYRRTGDNLTIRGAQVHQISYGFYKNQLESVLITTKGITNSVAILDVLRQAYGKGSRPNQFMDRYMWEGTRVFGWYDRKPKKEKARKGVSGL